MVGKRFPRSIRNNNPFNIKYGTNNWIGKTALNSDYQHTFEQFQSIEYGLRAGQKLILSYMHLYGLKTFSDILNRFAPNSENYTNRYIDFVCCDESGKKIYDENSKITSLAQFLHLCARICKFESGANYTMLRNLRCDFDGQKFIFVKYFKGVSQFTNMFNDLKTK